MRQPVYLQPPCCPQAKGYHDHPKPESKTPSELRKVTASYKRKLVDKRRTKAAALSRCRPETEREDLFLRFPTSAGGGAAGPPHNAGAEPEPFGQEQPSRVGDMVLAAGDCANNTFKCSGCKLSILKGQ